MKRFLSGDEAFAEGVRLARPQVSAWWRSGTQRGGVGSITEC